MLNSLAETDQLKVVVLGLGPQMALSKFKGDDLVVLPAFPTTNELFTSLHTKSHFKQSAPDIHSFSSTKDPLKTLIAEDNRINQKFSVVCSLYF